MKKNTTLLPLLFLFSFSCIHGATQLSGTLGDTTLRAQGNPYIVTGDVTITSNRTWNIEPGVVIKFSGLYSISGSGVKFYVHGKGDSLVYFTSIHDDSVRGDDNMNGNLTSPAPGNWKGISLLANSEVIIKNACFKFGGEDA